MTTPGPQPPSDKAPAAIVRDFIQDPMIRILGFLLIVAAGVLLYISPESSVPLRWRGGPVPESWQRIPIDTITIALPPDMETVGGTRYESDTLTLEVFTGDAAHPIVRDRDTMTGFRALSSQIQDRELRIASWKLQNTAQHQLGAAFKDLPLTLLFTATTENNLENAKTAIQSIQFN